jgi:thiol-disulfide isomerase/thioredoxin
MGSNNIFPTFAHHQKHIMKLKYLLCFILPILLVLHSCNSKPGEKVTISGTFTNLLSAKLYIYQLLPESKPLIDSVTTDASGTFSIDIPVEKAGYYTLYYNEANEITLVVLPGEKITLKGDGNAMRNTYTVDGSENSKLYAGYISFTDVNLKKVDSLSREFTESREKPDFMAIKKELDSAYMMIYDDHKEKVFSFVTNHLNSLASLLVISANFGPNPVFSEKTQSDLFLKLDSALMLAYPENSLVNTFHQRMLTLKAEIADIRMHDSLMKPGMPVPEIELGDSKGRKNKFSDLKNRLKLVYFWGSWDAGSRQLNSRLTALYNQYYTMGFTIYAVSVDSDPELWQNACSIDRITSWINVIDPKGLASEYSKTYGVRGIPYLVLVGKDGKIIARNPEFDELQRLIQKNI